MPTSNLKIWFRHFGIMMLILVVIPAILLASLFNISGTIGAGLKFGTYYFGISYFLFGDGLRFLQGVFAPFIQGKANIVAIFACWILVCIVVATFQLIVARFQASRKTKHPH